MVLHSPRIKTAGPHCHIQPHGTGSVCTVHSPVGSVAEKLKYNPWDSPSKTTLVLKGFQLFAQPLVAVIISLELKVFSHGCLPFLRCANAFPFWNFPWNAVGLCWVCLCCSHVHGKPCRQSVPGCHSEVPPSPS